MPTMCRQCAYNGSTLGTGEKRPVHEFFGPGGPVTHFCCGNGAERHTEQMLGYVAVDRTAGGVATEWRGLAGHCVPTMCRQCAHNLRTRSGGWSGMDLETSR